MPLFVVMYGNRAGQRIERRSQGKGSGRSPRPSGPGGARCIGIRMRSGMHVAPAEDMIRMGSILRNRCVWNQVGRIPGKCLDYLPQMIHGAAAQTGPPGPAPGISTQNINPGDISLSATGSNPGPATLNTTRPPKLTGSTFAEAKHRVRLPSSTLRFRDWSGTSRSETRLPLPRRRDRRSRGAHREYGANVSQL